MTWIGWLFLLAGVYVVIVLLRGAADFISWCGDRFLGEPSKPERREAGSKAHAGPPGPAPASAQHGAGQKDSHQEASSRRLPDLPPLTAPRRHRLASLAEFAKMLFAAKNYAYWVGAAMREPDPARKVKYCSKALQRNPGYTPAWGLKGNTLCQLQRYEEALECFDRILAIHPNAIAWYQKGLCCFHLGKHEQAIQCFSKTLAVCSDDDRELRADALRSKRSAEEQLQRLAECPLPKPE